MCGRYCIVGSAICIPPLLLSRMSDLSLLAVIALPSPDLVGCPLYYLSTADNRTKQITEQVKHVKRA